MRIRTRPPPRPRPAPGSARQGSAPRSRTRSPSETARPAFRARARCAGPTAEVSRSDTTRHTDSGDASTTVETSTTVMRPPPYRSSSPATRRRSMDAGERAPIPRERGRAAPSPRSRRARTAPPGHAGACRTSPRRAIRPAGPPRDRPAAGPGPARRGAGGCRHDGLVPALGRPAPPPDRQHQRAVASLERERAVARLQRHGERPRAPARRAAWSVVPAHRKGTRPTRAAATTHSATRRPDARSTTRPSVSDSRTNCRPAGPHGAGPSGRRPHSRRRTGRCGARTGRSRAPRLARP